jgi:hypothetical protein
MASQIDKGMILVATGAYTAHNTDTIGISHPVIRTITACSRKLLCLHGLRATPFFI